MEIISVRTPEGEERFSEEIRQVASTQLSFDYDQLDNKTRAKLINCRDSIYSTFKQTLENVILLGGYFTEARKLLKKGMFTEWVRTEFTEGPAGISYDSAVNWMRVYRTVRDNPEAKEAFQNLNLKVVYKLCMAQIDEDVRTVLLRQAAEGTRLNVQDIQTIKKLNAEIKLQEYNLVPEAQVALARTDVVETDVRLLNRVSRLPKQKQRELADVIITTGKENVREALEEVFSRIQPEDQDIVAEPVEVSVSHRLQQRAEFEVVHRGPWSQALAGLSELNLVIVECPLRYSWRDEEQGLGRLSTLVDSALAPGGFVIAVMGHKAIMGCEAGLAPLEPLHVLTLRHQPGRTRAIPGINIGAASALAAFAYKPPYRSPKSLLIDLQTWGGESAIDGMDEIESGIEAGFHRWITTLVEQGDQVAHIVLEPQSQFHIRAALVSSARQAGAECIHCLG